MRSRQVAKRQDFWSLVDAYFIKQMEANGCTLTTLKWKETIDRLVAEDKHLFNADFSESQSFPAPLTPVAPAALPQLGLSFSQQEGGSVPAYSGPSGYLMLMNPVRL
ncbi:hypothetical protein BDN71DRAFT_1513298 [Pleurotus eryngii]|uniref:Uncharacterized protein n=1 Tax=Pleurotus eryngii TaxID=5323 RepID=A0A9P5ZJ50_PLEER|nr:hypothetical protein BDN71DRAFT_1513298 [Pleurotus eryngii]